MRSPTTIGVAAFVAMAAPVAIGAWQARGVSPPPRAASVSPELFGVGAISTPDNELNAAFTPDGRTLYFTRKAGDGRFGAIVSSAALGAGRWAPPRVASFSGQYADYDPFVSPDGSRLFFISTRPAPGRAPAGDFDIWVVERQGTGWGTPRNLGAPINGAGDELYPTVASDGTLYFSSCGRGDSHGRCDIYRARIANGRYLEPENLGDSVNTPASETDAYIAPDQSYLVMAVYGRADALGDGDLYVSTQRNGAWSKARPLGAGINSVAREYCPIVSPDGKYLYFTSQRGFVDGPQRRPLTYAELSDSLAGVRNGLGNTYRVPVAVVHDST
jgi:dipeptidyl aminopeptidase/acylaminoacyl peptidase